MCDEAVRREPCALEFVPGHLNIQGMCNKAVELDTSALWYVLDHFKTQEMCDKAVEEDLGLLWPVLIQYKTQEMCDKAVDEDLCLLEYVPDSLMKQQHIVLCGDDDDYYGDDKLIEWYEDYQKRKAQKAQIKNELMPIAWYPDRVMDWCMSEDKKGWW